MVAQQIRPKVTRFAGFNIAHFSQGDRRSPKRWGGLDVAGPGGFSPSEPFGRMGVTPMWRFYFPVLSGFAAGLILIYYSHQ